MLAALSDEEREDKYARMDFGPRTDRTIRDVAAFRDEIRRTQRRGYSTDDRENEPYGACVGAAIVGPWLVFAVGAVVLGGIRYGLAGVKNVGSAAADTVLPLSVIVPWSVP